MNALALAGCGWVPADPAGHRLRWQLPAAVDSPGTLVLERAPLRYDALDVPRDVDLPAGLAAVPAAFWEQRGDVVPQGALFPLSVDLGGSYQAVRFDYTGTPGLVIALYGGQVVDHKAALDGHPLWLHGTAIDRLVVLAPQCVLESFAVLDLNHPPDLDWERIASFDVEGNHGHDHASVAGRHPGPATVDASQWDELRELWQLAMSEPLGTPGANGGPNAREALNLMLGVRWEHAVLCGLGFADGPQTAGGAVDRVDGPLLAQAEHVAYRVVSDDGRFDPSNVVCLPGADALPLPPPGAPSLHDDAVRLMASGTIRAMWRMRWTATADTIAAEVDEQLHVGGTTHRRDYESYGREDDQPVGSGASYREQDVEAAQVALTLRLRGRDGFDRASPWGDPSGPHTLPIDHAPQAPLFAAADHDGTTARLRQPTGVAWQPDALVDSLAGRVRIVRRVAQPRTATIDVQQVLKGVDGGVVLQATGAAPPDVTELVGGRVAIDGATGTLEFVVWPALYVALPTAAGGATAAVTAPAKAKLTQSPTHGALFTQVHEVAAAGFPGELVFTDPLPSPSALEIVEYRAKVAFASLEGPLGGAVQALRLPATPVTPPPFTVTRLGVDFYERTLVQIELLQTTGDRLEVWWAKGHLDVAAFAQRAVPGDAGTRHAESGRLLWDTLSLPVPRQVAREVTFGVQGVNGADGRGPFVLVHETLTPA